MAKHEQSAKKIKPNSTDPERRLDDFLDQPKPKKSKEQMLKDGSKTLKTKGKHVRTADPSKTRIPKHAKEIPTGAVPAARAEFLETKQQNINKQTTNKKTTVSNETRYEHRVRSGAIPETLLENTAERETDPRTIKSHDSADIDGRTRFIEAANAPDSMAERENDPRVIKSHDGADIDGRTRIIERGDIASPQATSYPIQKYPSPFDANGPAVYTYAQQQQLVSAQREGLTPEQIKSIENPIFSGYQMRQIKKLYMLHEPSEFVSLFNSQKLSPQQMYEIKRARNDGLTQKQLETLADNKLNRHQLSAIRESCLVLTGKGMLDEETIRFVDNCDLKNPQNTPEQLNEILQMIKDDATTDEIKEKFEALRQAKKETLEGDSEIIESSSVHSQTNNQRSSNDGDRNTYNNLETFEKQHNSHNIDPSLETDVNLSRYSKKTSTHSNERLAEASEIAAKASRSSLLSDKEFDGRTTSADRSQELE